MATVRFDASMTHSKKINQLLEMLNDNTVRKEVNRYIGNAIQPFVPKKRGYLRSSMYISPKFISWGRRLKYAPYQYYGKYTHYTTPGTRSYWTKAYAWDVKRQTNLEITQYLKRECKRRGLNV